MHTNKKCVHNFSTKLTLIIAQEFGLIDQFKKTNPKTSIIFIAKAEPKQKTQKPLKVDKN